MSRQWSKVTILLITIIGCCTVFVACGSALSQASPAESPTVTSSITTFSSTSTVTPTSAFSAASVAGSSPQITLKPTPTHKPHHAPTPTPTPGLGSIPQPPPKCITVSTQSITFMATQGQGDPSPQTVTISNCGPAGDWSASSALGSNWLKANPDHGHLDAKGTPGATQDVQVVVSIANLTPGEYFDRITFTLGSSSVKVDVKLIVLQ